MFLTLAAFSQTPCYSVCKHFTSRPFCHSCPSLPTPSHQLHPDNPLAWPLPFSPTFKPSQLSPFLCFPAVIIPVCFLLSCDSNPWAQTFLYLRTQSGFERQGYFNDLRSKCPENTGVKLFHLLSCTPIWTDWRGKSVGQFLNCPWCSAAVVTMGIQGTFLERIHPAWTPSHPGPVIH